MGEPESAVLSEHITQAPVLFITGAGASVPLGRWTTTQFLASLENSLPAELKDPLKTVIDSCQPSEGLDALDIEEVLDHIEGMNDTLETLTKNVRLRNIIVEHQPPRDDLRNLLDAYSRIKDLAYDLVVEHYRDIDKVKAAKLYRWILVDLPSEARMGTLPLFTLNYDLAVEMACEYKALPLVDGVSSTRRRQWFAAGFYDYRPQEKPTIVLFKLHGSVNWCRTPKDQIVEIHDTLRDPAPNTHCILYPSMRQKEVRAEPFKTAYAYLGACLKKAKVAVIIGTTLRDGRLVDTLSQGADQNPNLTFVNCRPSADSAGLAARLGIPTGRVIPIAGRFGVKKVDAAIRHEVAGALGLSSRRPQRVIA